MKKMNRRTRLLVLTIVMALVLIAGAARALRQSPCETDISSHK